MKAHKCSLVNRRLGNCNLLVLVVIIAHLFRKVNNLQKNFLCIFIYLLQFTRPARSGQISCLHGNLTDQQDGGTPVYEQNKAASKLCLQLAATHGTCGFVNRRLVNCNATNPAREIHSPSGMTVNIKGERLFMNKTKLQANFVCD